jgi:NAD(P)-dependent dehydrogenase (short-subunit alcohol dehydrogenase family)
MRATVPSSVVLITGASGGLGSAVTNAFLASGAVVAGSSRRIADSAFPHPNFRAFPADLADPAQARALADAVIALHGHIDALVHVTGGFAGGAPVHESDDALWDQMFSINLRAALHTFRAVIPHMRAAKRGRIVAVGSRAAIEPAANIAAYSASKAALVSLVKTVALENRDVGITANAILPGTIDTAGNREWGTPEERAKWVSPERLAALAEFLVSDAAAEITGAAIPVYGSQ